MGNKGNLTFIQANEWIKLKYLPDVGKKIAFKPSNMISCKQLNNDKCIILEKYHVH